MNCPKCTYTKFDIQYVNRIFKISPYQDDNFHSRFFICKKCKFSFYLYFKSMMFFTKDLEESFIYDESFVFFS